MLSDCIKIECADGRVDMTCEDGSHFSVPEADCALLSIAHSSAEELAAFLCERLRERLTVIANRGVTSLEVTVAEAPQQEARFRMDI